MYTAKDAREDAKAYHNDEEQKIRIATEDLVKYILESVKTAAKGGRYTFRIRKPKNEIETRYLSNTLRDLGYTLSKCPKNPNMIVIGWEK